MINETRRYVASFCWGIVRVFFESLWLLDHMIFGALLIFFTSWNNQLFNPMTPNHQNRWLEMTNLLPMSFMSSQFSNRWCCATRGEGELRDGCLTKNTRVLMSWICPPWQGSYILSDIHKKRPRPFSIFSYLGLSWKTMTIHRRCLIWKCCSDLYLDIERYSHGK